MSTFLIARAWPGADVAGGEKSAAVHLIGQNLSSINVGTLQMERKKEAICMTSKNHVMNSPQFSGSGIH